MIKFLTYFSLIIFFSTYLFASDISQSKSGFSNHEIDLINSSFADIPMQVLLTTSKEDSLILRTPSNDLDLNDENLDLFLKRLYATVTDSASLGVGIAAPQVGILKKIILVQRFDKEGEPFEAYINPKILKYSEKKQDCREGCLSIPDIMDTTRTRSYAIMLEYDLADKTHNIEMVEGFTAVIFQHEIDHVNGILFIDRLKEATSSRND